MEEEENKWNIIHWISRIIKLYVNLYFFDSKKFIVRFCFYWRPPEGFYFHWRCLKKCFLKFKTLSRMNYIPLDGFRYLSRGVIIPQEGFRYPSWGVMIPLEGFSYPSKEFIIPLEGFRCPSWGVIVPLEGFSYPS